MVKGKVIFEDEEKIEIKYPCFELKDIVEYYFEIKTPDNSINPFESDTLHKHRRRVLKQNSFFFFYNYSIPLFPSKEKLIEKNA